MPKYVLTDAEVKLTGYLSEKKYPESFRLIRYYDEEDDREFTFLTNATHVSALDIANLYKKRWLVELFFKWLKQHLKIKYCCPIKILRSHKIRADFICEVSPFSLDFSRQTK